MDHVGPTPDLTGSPATGALPQAVQVTDPFHIVGVANRRLS